MKHLLLLLMIASTNVCTAQDSTFILKKIYEEKYPKRLFRFKDTSDNCFKYYDYIKENRKPYRINIYPKNADTAYNFIFVDSSLFYCQVLIKKGRRKRDSDGYRYWVYNKRLFPLVLTRKKLTIQDNHLFILDKADQVYHDAELFLLNH